MTFSPVLSIAEFAEVQGGLQVTHARAELPREVPYLRVANVHRDRLDLTEVKRIRVTSGEFDRARLRVGDVLVVEGHGNRDEIGRSAVWRGELEDCVHQNHLIRVRVDGARASAAYLSAFLNSPIGRVQLVRAGKTTSGLNTININNVRSVRVPLPSLSEQRRIANILDKADAIRRRRKEVIALTEEFLRSAFFEMFGDPVSNPRRWPVRTLEALAAEMKYGTSEKCSAAASGEAVPVLRIPNVVGGEVVWDDLKYAALDATERDRLRLSRGDVLFVRSNGNPEYIARCAVFDDAREALFASYLIRVRLRSEQECAPAYLQSALATPSYRAVLTKAARTTAGNYNISTEGLRRLQIPVPPSALQASFLELRARLRELQERLGNALRESEQLFSSLAQRAFRGELAAA